MALEKLRGIIIECKDYREKDKLVQIYTLEQGKIYALFRGVRGEKAKMKSQKNLFTFGDFFIENTKGNNIVTQVDVIETFYSLSQDLDKYYEACSIIDIVKKLGTEQSDPSFFIEIIKSLRALCFGNIKKNYVLIKLLLKVFDGSGFPLNFDCCSGCGVKITGKKFMNYEVGEILCGACRTFISEELSDAVVTSLRVIKNLEYEKLETIKLVNDVEKDCIEVLLKNFQCRFNSKIFVVL